MKYIRVAISATLLMLLCSWAYPQTKEQKRAQRFVRHQHLVVQAIKEILDNNVDFYCKSLPTKDCEQARADQAEMLRIIHTVADHDSGQGAF